MSDEEKTYFYFKAHDLDGNDKLDGLEIFYSATHHTESETSDEHHHQHQHEQEEDGSLPAIDNNSENEIQNSSVTNPKLSDGKDEAADNKNVNHIIGMCRWKIRKNKQPFLACKPSN